jgi:glycosyltransferase involved in cell wall biosynthesis
MTDSRGALTQVAKPGARITVVILTFNEERHLARAIDSVSEIAAEVLIVDSFSTDNTVAVAKSRGARVLQNRFINYSKQYQWALDAGDISTEWIMRLDADEVLEPDLVAEISHRLPTLSTDVVGINFDRKHIFMDRWIRHGGRYPLRLLRLWRRGHGRIEQRWMDEHIVVWGGEIITFRGGFADINLNDLSFFTDKHNKYATREALDVLSQRYGLFAQDKAFHDNIAPRQASAKRWVKEGFYNRLPFWAGPLGYFLYRYFIQLGFLDGRAGLIYHFLQGFWYRFLVGAKVVEFEKALVGSCSNSDRIARLVQLTGHTLDPDG